MPSIQKCVANFIQKQISTFDNERIKQRVKNRSTHGVFYSKSKEKGEPEAPTVFLSQSHGITHLTQAVLPGLCMEPSEDGWHQSLCSSDTFFGGPFKGSAL